MERQNSVQLTTAPTAASAIERFLGLETSTRLSPAALGAFAIVTSNGRSPARRWTVSGGQRGRRHPHPGGQGADRRGGPQGESRPADSHGTTPAFLGHFGLVSLEELPELEENGEELREEENDSCAERLRKLMARSGLGSRRACGDHPRGARGGERRLATSGDKAAGPWTGPGGRCAAQGGGTDDDHRILQAQACALHRRTAYQGQAADRPQSCLSMSSSFPSAGSGAAKG